MIRSEIDFNRVYESNNYGKFKIIREVNPRKGKRYVLIEFLETGYQNEVLYGEVLSKCVKDKYKPSIHGVGYLGNAHKKGNVRLYNIWVNILSRCYNANDINYCRYGMKGCYVAKEWHCFEIFLQDIKLIPGYDEMIHNNKEKYELDKDVRSNNQKCYSKDTCSWIKKDSNNRVHLVQANELFNYTSKYIGVVYDKRYGNFQAQINYRGKQYYLGKYTSEIAAANVYNFYAKQIGIKLTINDCPYMNIDECMKYKTTKRKINFIVLNNLEEN